MGTLQRFHLSFLATTSIGNPATCLELVAYCLNHEKKLKKSEKHEKRQSQRRWIPGQAPYDKYLPRLLLFLAACNLLLVTIF